MWPLDVAFITAIFCVNIFQCAILISSFLLLYILSCFLSCCSGELQFILIHKNLVWISANLISIACKNFACRQLHFPLFPFFCAVSIQITSLYTVYAHQHRFIIVLCTFKSGRRKKLSKKIILFIFTYLLTFTCSPYFFVQIQVTVQSFDFSLQDFLIFLVGQVCWW